MKPLGYSQTGEFLTAKELFARPSDAPGSLLALTKEEQIKLAVARYSLEPDFKLGIIGAGLLTRDEIIDHIQRQDQFGQMALEAEMGYCGNLISELHISKIPKKPSIPKKRIPVTPDWKIIRRCLNLKLKTRALFCENTTDAVTTPFANYRIAHVHPAFAARGFTVISLTGVDDVRTKFVPEAKNGLTVYIGGVGHGSYTVYTGHFGNHILEVGFYDPAEVAGKAIHLLSCETAAQLGPDTVANGAKCFAGYTENFNFVWDDSTTPVDEFLCFVEADSTFDIMMANGATALQAYNATIAAFNAELLKPGIPGSAAAAWLTYDRDHFKLLGTAATTVLPYRYIKICFPLIRLEKQNALVEAGELAD